MKNFLRSVSIFFVASLAASQLWAVEPTTFWIEPCSVVTTACVVSDMDLARWALAAWEKASEGRLHFVETRDRASGQIRVMWAEKDSGLYGEAVPIVVNGKRGSELHILVPEPATGANGSSATVDPKGDPKNDTPAPLISSQSDALLRDTIVYLTCLHESGHALGLPHTRAFADIMYSFQFGGDINEYFGRYRRNLKIREDIRQHAGMSPADKAALLERIPQAIAH
jgi:Matrixin